MPRTGVEPALLSKYAPETYASTNSATWACIPLFGVPRTRLELAPPYGDYPLKVACLPIPPPGLADLVFLLEIGCKSTNFFRHGQKKMFLKGLLFRKMLTVMMKCAAFFLFPFTRDFCKTDSKTHPKGKNGYHAKGRRRCMTVPCGSPSAVCWQLSAQMLQPRRVLSSCSLMM